MLGEEGERLAGTPLGQALGDLTLQVRALATVLGELGRSQSIGERGEAAGRVDRRQLGAVADQDQAARSAGPPRREPLERARRHHRGLVADDHRAGGDRLVVTARDAIEQQRRRLRRDAGVALQDVGGLALPGDADHGDARALVGLAHRLEGEGLARPRARLHDAHPGVPRAEVAHRGGLVCAERRPGVRSPLDRIVEREPAARVDARGRLEQAHLAAEHVGRRVERLLVAAIRLDAERRRAATQSSR